MEDRTTHINQDILADGQLHVGLQGASPVMLGSDRDHNPAQATLQNAYIVCKISTYLQVPLCVVRHRDLL